MVVVVVSKTISKMQESSHYAMLPSNSETEMSSTVGLNCP